MNTQQTQPNPAQIQNEHQKMSRAQLAQAVHTTGELSNSVAALRTEADRAKNILGFGRRILVSPDEIPWVNRFIGQENSANGNTIGSLGSVFSGSRVIPYLKQMMAEMNPRMFSSLKVADVVERLGSVAIGDEDLVTAVTNLKQDASFRMVGDLPIGPFLSSLGLKVGDGDDLLVEAIEVENAN